MLTMHDVDVDVDVEGVSGFDCKVLYDFPTAKKNM